MSKNQIIQFYSSISRDEDAPKKIPDPNAKKPDGWLDDAPENIPDPNAKRPADWDDEEDGEWEAPQIANPKCTEIGCGKWKPPMIDNPNYKGKWEPPMITNPKYKVCLLFLLVSIVLG